MIKKQPIKTAPKLSNRKIRGGWSIPAGFPSEAYNYKEDRLDLNKYIVRQKRGNRCMWANHRGIIGGSIIYGDLIVFDELLTPNEGALQVFFVDDEYSLRYKIQYNDRVELVPYNSDLKTIIIPEGEELSGQGVVTHVIKKFSVYRNQYGGYPVDVDQYVEHGMDYTKYIVERWEATFFMWADGDSMLGDYIEVGDLLIFDKYRRKFISEHDILAFNLNNQFVLKRHKNYGDTGELISSNPRYKPLPIATGDEGKVWGVLTCVIKKFL